LSFKAQRTQAFRRVPRNRFLTAFPGGTARQKRNLQGPLGDFARGLRRHYLLKRGGPEGRDRRIGLHKKRLLKDNHPIKGGDP